MVLLYTTLFFLCHQNGVVNCIEDPDCDASSSYDGKGSVMGGASVVQVWCDTYSTGIRNEWSDWCNIGVSMVQYIQ